MDGGLLLFGRAVQAKQATYSEFDRKSYFYLDIPKAYQISQYQFPFLMSGELAGVKLTRVHLEEDTARMNRFIESWVLQMPDQYFWLHKRFKTRPEGEPSVYGKHHR